jgi:ATP-dependent Clp protease ATP-binding subunit ClpA
VQEVVPFRQLTRDGFKTLLSKKLDKVVAEQADAGRKLKLPDRKKWLEAMAKAHFDGHERDEISGRDINRLINRQVRIPLGKILLDKAPDCNEVFFQLGSKSPAADYTD